MLIPHLNKLCKSICHANGAYRSDIKLNTLYKEPTSQQWNPLIHYVDVTRRTVGINWFYYSISSGGVNLLSSVDKYSLLINISAWMYVCVLIRVYLYVCMHVYIYMCIYMCSIYMFMRRVCIHTRIPSFSELRFYVVYNIENRPFLGRGFNHAYIWMFYCVLYVIWNTYCFNVFYWIYGIRIVLLVFTWYVEYVLSACIFLSCFTYLCLVRNDLINMFKHLFLLIWHRVKWGRLWLLLL